jgi:hypothetical protein
VVTAQPVNEVISSAPIAVAVAVRRMRSPRLGAGAADAVPR